MLRSFSERRFAIVNQSTLLPSTSTRPRSSPAWRVCLRCFTDSFNFSPWPQSLHSSLVQWLTKASRFAFARTFAHGNARWFPLLPNQSVPSRHHLRSVVRLRRLRMNQRRRKAVVYVSFGISSGRRSRRSVKSFPMLVTILLSLELLILSHLGLVLLLLRYLLLQRLRLLYSHPLAK